MGNAIGHYTDRHHPCRRMIARPRRAVPRPRPTGGANSVSPPSASPTPVSPEDEQQLEAWLQAGMHGDMGLHAAASAGAGPPRWCRTVRRGISVRMDYWPGDAADPQWQTSPTAPWGYVSRYAVGRDYHRVMRQPAGSGWRNGSRRGSVRSGYRAFVDSGPGTRSRWRVTRASADRQAHQPDDRDDGLVVLPRRDSALTCRCPRPALERPLRQEACLPACPTAAIVAPGRLDARRCISYLTIELRPDPRTVPALLGNRIYGCDDCQLVCPWNKFARGRASGLQVRHGLDAPRLDELFGWSREQFERG